MSSVEFESLVAEESPAWVRGRRSSRDTAVAYVVDAIEKPGAATRDDFDVESIVTAGYIVAEGWDFKVLEPETFWRIASMFLRT